MKFQMTLLVFREEKLQGEIDVIAEYPTALDAIRAVAQLGATNSPLFAHPEVRKLLKGLSTKSLARINETMGEGVDVLIKSIDEYRVEMPEGLRNSPNVQHILASRPARKVPREGIIEALPNRQIH